MLWGFICPHCRAYHSRSSGDLTCAIERVASTGDKRYEFVTRHLRPGTEIRSHGQWRRFLKQHGMTDDLTPKELRDLAHTDTMKEKKSRERWAETKRQIEPAIERAVHQAVRR